MVDQERVCCMCGDIGFADKLFQCSSCRFRFQHLYCSNYYYGNHDLSSSSSSMMKSMEICDWCQSEGRNSSSNKSFKRSSSMDNHHRGNLQIRSEYNTQGERIKHHHHHDDDQITPSPRGTSKNNNNNSSSPGVPSPRTGVHRRYKLLKDVMC